MHETPTCLLGSPVDEANEDDEDDDPAAMVPPWLVMDG